ncbi:hypothetical protein EPUS_00693 [Endocarpon pusillum Z07020]|uniref:Uncharacterized protein n=1 Tax=Endocarpon pusillum (strain Z07020 / HMAS-L-300199) TaxID=1263415 RepID=U1GQE6_ENDPU|nr:uncharacterized protein EPUS_00693 [Endocarpon pusillum Z07020]ERF74563.1 hypothetical protein EPUS_00693 [Endocarpon pusillum Z07020]
MAGANEHQRQHASQYYEYLPMSEDGRPQPESPGMPNVQHLSMNHPQSDDTEVPAKVMVRPISSGSSGSQNFTFGVPRNRNIHIAKKHSTNLLDFPQGELSSNLDAGKPTDGEAVAARGSNQRSPAAQTPNDHTGHKRQSPSLRDIHTNLCHVSEPLPAGPLENSEATQDDYMCGNQELTNRQPSKRISVPETSRRTILTDSPELRLDVISVLPVSPAGASLDKYRADGSEPANSGHAKVIDLSPNIATNAEPSRSSEHTSYRKETQSVVDLTDDDRLNEKRHLSSQSLCKEDSPTHIELSSKSRVTSSEQGRHTPRMIAGDRGTVGSPHHSPKTPSLRARHEGVEKNRTLKQQQPSLLPSNSSAVSANRVPSEEDLYFLLLHRYRKREHIEKQLAARLRQVEAENTSLCEAAREYQKQLHDLGTSRSRQAAEIRAQKMVINDIKNGYVKIKDYMKMVHNEQESLKAKAISMGQEKRALRDEHDGIHQAIEEAIDSTTSSSHAINKLKTHLLEVRHDAAYFEETANKANLKLQGEQQLLVQERQKNRKYENHIVDITRQQDRLSLVIKREQQHVLNALNSIKDKLTGLEVNHATAAVPPTLPALDQCVEMLSALIKVETASPADVTDMIQVVNALIKSFDSSKKQFEESLQKATTARANADGNLLSQITQHFNELARDSTNQDEIAELRETKNLLEERVRGNENMLMEIGKSKVSSEKREEHARAGNDKLLDELSKLRELALTAKKDSGLMQQHQNLLIRYTGANSALVEIKQKIDGKDGMLQAQEQQIQSLSDQLGQARVDQQNLVEEVQELSKRLLEHVDTTNREKQQMLAEREMCIRDLREELTTLRNNCDSQVEELKQVKLAHRTILQELDESRSRLSQAIRDCDGAKSTIDDLNFQVAQMDDLRKQADCASSLALECEANNGVIADLRQKLESFKTMHQQLHDRRIDAENKSIEISELNTRLQTAEATKQQVSTLITELHECKEETRRLRGAQDRVGLLESQIHQKNEQIDQLNIKAAHYNDTLRKIDDLQKQLSTSKDECESTRLTLKTAREETARMPMLENETRAQKDEIKQLRAKLAEAENICTDVPKMQAQMDQFSVTFSNLKRDLEDAHRNAEDVQSTKATNASLRRTIVELQDQAAVAEQKSDSVKCLSEELQQKNAQITALRVELDRYHAESQLQKASRQADMEDLLGKDFFLETGRLAENNLAQNESGAINSDPTSMEKETRHADQEKTTSRKIRRSAIRSASNPEARTVEPDLDKDFSKLRHLRADAVPMASANQANGSHASAERNPDEVTVVPESQPRAQELHMCSPPRNVQGGLKGIIMSSSPLSDIGELFDPSDQDLPTASQDVKTQVHRNEFGDVALENSVAAIEQTLDEEDSLSNEGHQGNGSRRQTYNCEKLSQDSRPRSSSYGEPLLLDDLEGVGSLQTSGSGNIAPSTQSNPGTQDILTSPLSTLPRGLPKMNMQVRPKVTPLPRPDMKLVDANERSKNLPNNSSPRRVRSSESSSQTSTRRPLQNLGDDVNTARPATPLPVKEKHQPNSAIKRKSEAAGMSDEATPKGKKRARRNLSNMEVRSRQGTASQSLSSSTPDKAGQSMTRLKQSSNSTAGSRSAIVGKNAPAPGNRQRYNERFGTQRD